MWLQPSPWLDTTRQCSAEGHRELALDRERSVRYAHKLENTGFFSNVTTFLYLSGLVGGDTGAFRGRRNHPLTPHWHQEARNGKTAA
jgi:hypothetical protein